MFTSRCNQTKIQKGGEFSRANPSPHPIYKPETIPREGEKRDFEIFGGKELLLDSFHVRAKGIEHFYC